MGKQKKSIKESIKSKTSPFNDYWIKSNYVLVYLGIGLLILGFFLMTKSPWDNVLSLSVSPIILLIAYLIIIPLSILFMPTKKKNDVPSQN